MAGDENSALADEKSAPHKPPQGKFADFREFLYNKNNKDGKARVLGRTGRSWLEITIFYIIFYSCLAGFFAINLAIFLSTLDSQKPRYFGKGSIIGINPGLGYQPWIKDVAESTLISFKNSSTDNSSYAKYLTVMNSVWSRYKTKTDAYRDCLSDTESNKDADEKPCWFDVKIFEDEFCGQDHDFGFQAGQPCVMLTLNKLIEWEPVRYPNDSLPEALPASFRNSNEYTGDIAVVCEGEFDADKENIGEVQYIPTEGIKKKFFPYKYYPDNRYRQPFAMVKFKSLKPGILVEVECKAYAYNIVHDRTYRLGMVHFELYMQPDSFKAS